MQNADLSALLFVNGFARSSWTVDNLIAMVASDALLKDAILVAMLWWTWERKGGPRPGPTVLRTVAGVLLTILVSRILQDLLPARPRPLYSDLVRARGFVVPFGTPESALHDWSSFPSDNAALAFALATSVFLSSRWLGRLAFAWASLVICLPRLYLGYHYLSDLIGGALLGAAIVLAVAKVPLPSSGERRIDTLMQAHRGIVYAALFLLSFQIATTFDDFRQTARTVGSLTLHYIHKNYFDDTAASDDVTGQTVAQKPG